MKAGHDEIQREKNLRVPRVPRIEDESGSRYVVLAEFGVVLEALDAQEDAAEEHRDHQEGHQLAPLARLRRVHRERHRQAAGNENGRVGRAGPDDHLVARRGERVRIPHAIDRIDGEQPAEEQDFGREEHPHAEGRGLFLLAEILELMGERRVRRFSRFRQRGPRLASDIRTRPR
jgi:hypothetical protein